MGRMRVTLTTVLILLMSSIGPLAYCPEPSPGCDVLMRLIYVPTVDLKTTAELAASYMEQNVVTPRIELLLSAQALHAKLAVMDESPKTKPIAEGLKEASRIPLKTKYGYEGATYGETKGIELFFSKDWEGVIDHYGSEYESLIKMDLESRLLHQVAAEAICHNWWRLGEAYANVGNKIKAREVFENALARLPEQNFTANIEEAIRELSQ